jgi:hypothetical protein
MKVLALDAWAFLHAGSTLARIVAETPVAIWYPSQRVKMRHDLADNQSLLRRLQ